MDELKNTSDRLRDKSLFKEPPPKDDCPICFVPMPSAYQKIASFHPCCGKIVCKGCVHSCARSSTSGDYKCPFCNAEIEDDNKKRHMQMKKRVKANDVNTLTELGCFYFNGSFGLEQDCNKAFELMTRAAELGSIRALYAIGTAYFLGEGVDIDRENAKHYFELAAMAGHELARFDVGRMENDCGNAKRAIKHWVISASAGHDNSMKAIRSSLEQGLVERDEYKLTLKAYIDSSTEMRSETRDDAARWMQTRVVRW